MHDYPEATQSLETRIPETLFQWRADIELARDHAEICKAAQQAMNEVSPSTPGFNELMAYALSRVVATAPKDVQ